ncbi:HAMP domain-containing sensor histidine kinase [Halonatronum saccharophilum]|uniref:HAMP domain-containing sensor histidine kinase n=1 Tax=Halonatronum saccharophilum TaxID=150060 RepID=UPI000482C5A6|nr:ATP-binding protein [Halonatronum saccharophilum]
MIRTLFAKVMVSYIFIPLLILLILITILPTYLEEYFSRAKERELLNKSEVVVALIEEIDKRELNNLILNLEKIMDTSILLFDQRGRTINQGRMMRDLMRDHHSGRTHEMHNRFHGEMEDHNEIAGNIRSRIHNYGAVRLEEEIDRVLEGREVSFKGESQMLVEPIIGVGTPLDEGGVFLLSPLRGVQETVDKVNGLALRVTLGGALLALILGFFISRGITKPIKDMQDKVNKMSKGDFAVPLENLPKDEIGSLGDAFNTLSEKLEYNIRALSNEKKRMKEMLTSMAEGVLGVSIGGEVILTNPKIEEIFKLNEDIIGEDYSDCFIDELKVLIDKVLIEEEEVKGEFEFEEKVLLAHGAPIKEDGDKLWGVIILIRDVTEIRKLDEMRRLFVANVSHELKTPLTAIRGYLEAIVDGVVEDKEVELDYLKRVLSEGDRMSRLIKDILDLARLQSGQLEFNIESFDLTSLVQGVLRNLERRFEGRDVKVVGPGQLIVRSDPNRLEEVLINLLTNAIKFTEEDGKVEVRVKEGDGDVLVEVIDDGLGIPKGELSYIWERFHQVDRARRPDKEGTGLGLSIVKEIIEGLGGRLGVESEEGEGSRFYFVLNKLFD